MAKPLNFWKLRTLLIVCLSALLALTACSGGNVPQVNKSIKDTSLESRQAAANAELPKAAVADGVAPLAKTGANLPAKSAPGQANPAAGSDPAAAAAVVPVLPLADLAQPAPQVDTSLPVEPRVGARAPEFTLQTLDGQSVTTADLLGRPVVISYWATWCIPCQQELPILQGLYQEYQDKGLVVLTVNAIDQDSTDKVQAMIAEKGMSLPVLLDTGSDFAGTYEAIFFPTTYYIDPAGVIRFIKLGDSTEADLRAHVEGLLRGDL